MVTVLWDNGPAALDRYRFALGGEARTVDSAQQASRALLESPEVDQVVIGPEVDLEQACQFAEDTRVERHEVGVILLRTRLDVTALSQALRSGIREVVGADDHGALADALRRSRELTGRLSGQMGGTGGGKEGRIVTVFSAKGGVGKTTLSTNLATYLASKGFKTLLVDLDLSFGDVAISLQLLPTRSIYDAVAMSGHIDEQGVASLICHHESSGLDVICAPNDPSDADRIPVHTVVELLKVAKQSYDFVLVDTPPSFTEHVLSACDISTTLVLIATLDIPAVKNLRIALDTLDMLGSPREARVIVLNRSDAKVGLRAEDVVAAIKQPIAVSVPASPSVPAAINRGVPIVLDEPKHPVSIAIREIADGHVSGDVEAAHGGEQTRKGLFGRGRK